MDAWIHRLKDAYDAGYYRTEPAAGVQTPFPWQNKTCRDCPFWSNGICAVHTEYRNAMSHTCLYFDPWNRSSAENLLQEQQAQRLRPWWEWFDDQNAAR